MPPRSFARYTRNRSSSRVSRSNGRATPPRVNASSGSQIGARHGRRPAPSVIAKLDVIALCLPTRADLSGAATPDTELCDEKRQRSAVEHDADDDGAANDALCRCPAGSARRSVAPNSRTSEDFRCSSWPRGEASYWQERSRLISRRRCCKADHDEPIGGDAVFDQTANADRWSASPPGAGDEVGEAGQVQSARVPGKAILKILPLARDLRRVSGRDEAFLLGRKRRATPSRRNDSAAKGDESGRPATRRECRVSH